MMRSVEQALGTTKPFTSVTVWIDRLSSNSYAEDDFDGIPELVEAINIQSSGPSEASRQIRKKLKYGSIHGQKRAITLLSALVENCGPRFQQSFADQQLVERIKLSSQDPLVDASVRRKLMRMLLGWQQQFRGERNMQHVAGLYAACGGGRKSDAQMRSEASEAYRKRKDAEDKDRQMRSDRKAAERLQKEEDARTAKERKKNGGKRPIFDLQKEKPQIMSALASSQQAATSLVNALQHVNREKESVTENARVQQYLTQVKTERKRIVRYIQLVRDEEYLGGLISANDQVILALELYDKLSKTTADHDSDEDEPLTSIKDTRSAAEKAQDRAVAEDREIAMVQKRLAQAHFEEGQLETLQDKQRMRVERHNSYRSQASGLTGASGSGNSHVRDLMDLNFDDDGHGRPPHAVLSPTTSYTAASSSSRGAAGTASSRGQNATLSDYSDYESESDEDIAAIAGAGQPKAPLASAAASSDDEYDDGHRPSIGPDSLYNYGEGDDDFDPFADPDEPAHEADSGFSQHKRQEYAVV